MKAHRTEPSIAEQAAQWLIAMEDPEQYTRRAEFAAWLKISPRNVEEFLLAAAAWEHFNGIDAQRRMEITTIVAETAENVLTLPEKAPRFISSLAPAKGRARSIAVRRLSMAAALGAIALACWWTLPVLNGTRQYATATGEQRAIKLPDGSIVQLNTQSRIAAHFTERGRDIRLLEGEALFTVARDTARPFHVRAGDTLIRALGTQFNVYKRPGSTTVSVIEGAVSVSDGNAGTKAGSPQPANAAPLKAGEEARISASGRIARHASLDVKNVLAWRERRLIFRDDTLPDIIAEFNRYNEGFRLRLTDAPDSNMRLTGVFRADDPETLLLFLAANSNLVIHKTATGALIQRQ